MHTAVASTVVEIPVALDGIDDVPFAGPVPHVELVVTGNPVALANQLQVTLPVPALHWRAQVATPGVPPEEP